MAKSKVFYSLISSYVTKKYLKSMTTAMELENSAQKKMFITKEMNDIFTNDGGSKTFFFRDRGLEDAGAKKCGITGYSLKANNLVTKITSCGHMFLTDEYYQRQLVSHWSNSARPAIPVQFVMDQQILSLEIQKVFRSSATY